MYGSRGATLGQEYDRLSRRIAAANHGDIGLVIEVRFNGCARVINAGPSVAIGADSLQLSPADARGQQQDPATNLRAAIELQRVHFVRGPRWAQSFDSDRGDQRGAELEHLQNPAHGKVRAAQPAGK